MPLKNLFRNLHFWLSAGTPYTWARTKIFWIWFICTLEGCVVLWTCLILKKVQIWNTLVNTHKMPKVAPYYHKLLERKPKVGKSFQNWTPVFDQFCLFWCKLARCFPKHLHFSPFVTLQRKSFQNLTPLPGHFLRRGKCANWSLDGGVSLHFTVRYLWNKAPRRKKSRGWIWVLWGWLPPGTVQLCPPVTKACIKQIVWSKLSIQHRP